MSADRIFSLFLVIGALAFVFLVLPRGAAALDYGAMTPRTMPAATALAIAALALIQVVRPAPQPPDMLPRSHEALRAAIMLGAAALAALIIPHLGFLPVSICLALFAFLLMGERRPLWLLLGGGGMPLCVWLVVTQLLDRNLP